MSVTRWTMWPVVLVALASPVRAQTYSPYSDFQNLTPSELASLQVKLTYLGPYDYPVQSLTFTSTSGNVNLPDFVPFRRNAFVSEYGLDNIPPETFKVAPSLLDAMIDSVATLPQVTDGGVDSTWHVSFAMIETANGTRGFESILNGANATALVSKILAAFAGHAVPTRAVSEAGCRMGFMPENPPQNVTGSTSVKKPGFRRVRGTDEFTGQLRITNTSGATLAAPLTLVPGVIGANVALIGEEGWTCSILPKGQPYVTLPVGAGLAPNATVTLTLRIRNPSLERIDVEPQVFAGAGTR